MIGDQDIAALKAKILASGLSISQLVSTAWASASTFRGSDKRGGANGARIRLAPQKDWDVNQPAALAKVLAKLEAIQKDFNGSQSNGNKGKKISLADLIVLGGCAAVEEAAKKAGHDVKIPFSPGRTDASQAADRCARVRSPRANRRRVPQLLCGWDTTEPAEELLARSGAVADPDCSRDDGSNRRHARSECQLQAVEHGVFTKRPETLTNDFFVNLLSMNTVWKASTTSEGVFEGHDRSDR